MGSGNDGGRGGEESSFRECVLAAQSVCDVNRVQGVTSSQGRLLTSAVMPKSAVGGWREDMKADGQRGRDGRRGDKRVEEI